MNKNFNRSSLLKVYIFTIMFVFITFSGYIYKDSTTERGITTVAKADEIKERKKVYVGGEPLGIKINTKGLLVIGVADIETIDGIKTSPSVKAGIQIGDSILKISGKTIKTSEDIGRIINENKGKEMELEIERKEKIFIKKITPIKSKLDDSFKIGMWVRDSSSGIGTLTFYDKENSVYGALGHGISDMDTGNIVKIGNGEIITSEIIAVRKSSEGNPGELKGIFKPNREKLGNIKINNICGIFGQYTGEFQTKKDYKQPLEIAYQDEIKEGKAKIYTTVSGEGPKLYDIEIEKLNHQEMPNSKSMLIKITDRELLEKTGGIVQGMSGSPIIQDNKIVGAVTHVLVNKPNSGYGIYIDWMIKESKKVNK